VNEDEQSGNGLGGYALVDVDDTAVQVHGHAKQGAWFGWTRRSMAAAPCTPRSLGGGGVGDVRMDQRVRPPSR
jgi:hypothetical protein